MTREDQQSINEFGRLSTNFRELRAEIRAVKKRLNDVQEASQDLDLFMGVDDPLVSVGEVFVQLEFDAAQERLAQVKAQIEGELKELRDKKSAMKARMSELKTLLYKRLGDAVYLEFSDDEEE